MSRSTLLALAFVVPLALPFLLACAGAEATRSAGGSPAGPSFDAGFQAMPPRDAAVYADVDWMHVSPQAYGASLTGYVGRVRPGNQHALGDMNVKVRWAQYLNAFHNQLHPAFADSFLDGLERRDAGDALDDSRLFTSLEIGVGANGDLSVLGVVHSSGQIAFDLAALEAVTRSGPYAAPPAELRSSDGIVYFHWEFHRDPVFACSTMNARPFRLVLEPAGVATHD